MKKQMKADFHSLQDQLMPIIKYWHLIRIMLLQKIRLSYIREFEASVRKGINPNEIKGVIRDAATGQPIAYASIRVKDTAAENHVQMQKVNINLKFHRVLKF